VFRPGGTRRDHALTEKRTARRERRTGSNRGTLYGKLGEKNVAKNFERGVEDR